jgi:hypothetical protein
MTVRHSEFRPDYGLALMQFDWGHPSTLQLQYLAGRGVSYNALLLPWPVGAIQARFDGDYFIPDPNSERCLTFVAFDRGGPFDVVAWQPKSGRLGVYLGHAFCLGDHDDIDNPALTWGDGALQVHSSPWEWLRADRAGIVVVRPKLAHAYLANVPRIHCSDVSFGKKLETWIQPPRPRAQLLVEEKAA